MDWEALRDDYPTLSRVNYLNSCSLGALSRQCREAHDLFFEQWTDMGAAAWYEVWMEEIATWRRSVARLIGCQPEEVAWTYAVGPSLVSLSGALDRQNRTGEGTYAGRPDVLLGDLEFPSSVAAWGPRPGTSLQWVRSPDGVQIPVDAYRDGLTDSTQVVMASRVFYATGAVQDVSAISAAARDNGSLCVVDDYHGTGQVPLDVKEQGIDCLVGGPLKWLCGGPVSAFLYVRKDLIGELEPQSAGWWADETMFDFRLEEFRFWDDARRFEGGTVNMHGVFTSRAAIDRINDLGVPAIRGRVRDLAGDLEERLEDAGFRLRSHPDAGKRTGIVMVETDDPKAAVARLGKQGIIVDDRPGCVRVSPHFYNTHQEGEAFVDAMVQATR